MQELPLMQKFYPLDHLNTYLEHTLQIHLSATLIKNIFEGWSEQIHHEYVHIALSAAVVGPGDPVVGFVIAIEEVNELGLVEQLRMLR